MSNSKLNQLREEYQTLHGKKPFAGWKEDTLKDKIAELKGETQANEPTTKARAFWTEENAKSVESSYIAKGYKTKVKKEKDGKFYLYIAK